MLVSFDSRRDFLIWPIDCLFSILVKVKGECSVWQRSGLSRLFIKKRANVVWEILGLVSLRPKDVFAKCHKAIKSSENVIQNNNSLIKLFCLIVSFTQYAKHKNKLQSLKLIKKKISVNGTHSKVSYSFSIFSHRLFLPVYKSKFVVVRI